MRWITRVFVSAAVRRIAAICVLALLAWLGIGTARAQPYPDQGAAWAACSADNAFHIQQAKEAFGPDDGQHITGNCEWELPQYHDRYASRIQFKGSHYATMGLYAFPIAKTCSSRPDQTGLGPWSTHVSTREGTTQCDAGCWRSWYSNGDGTMTGKTTLGEVCDGNNKKSCEAIGGGMYFNPAINGCELPEVETCPVGQQKNAAGDCVVNQCPNGMVEGPTGTCINEKNECPAGEVKSPTGQCLPGEGRCAQGEARGKDGTCKRDSDGDGIPDNEDDDPSNDDEKESFSGGDNCNSPPACNGSPIQCGQARIQWRIECNTRRNVTITGGACTSMPICAGKECNAMEYSQLLQQWKAACALEKLSNQTGGGTGGSDPNVARIADALTGNAGNPNLGEDPGPGGAFSDESGYGQDGYPGNGELDDDGFGFSRTCPIIPPVNVFGSTISFDTSVVCRWLTLGGQLVLVFAGLVSLRIMSGSNT